jgi:membrane associated rhomboid family serine protease
MGLYDRDYGRYSGNASAFNFGGSARTLTTNIVLFTCGVFVIQLLTRGPAPQLGNPGDQGWFTDLFSLQSNLLAKPWHFFQLLSYGFLHDVWDFRHIIFNMITFWFFGRAIEYRYGQREFLAFYLLAIIAGGLVWLVGTMIIDHSFTPISGGMLGASGGVMAVLLLFCLNYPHETILIWGVLPVPAWALGILYVGLNIFGAGGRPIGGDTHIAYTAHLGGALFAILYYQFHWRVSPFLPSSGWLENIKPKPKLRVVDPDSSEESTEAQVDAILQKIQEHGRESLTRKERRILEEASQQYQKRRR